MGRRTRNVKKYRLLTKINTASCGWPSCLVEISSLGLWTWLEVACLYFGLDSGLGSKDLRLTKQRLCLTSVWPETCFKKFYKCSHFVFICSFQLPKSENKLHFLFCTMKIWVSLSSALLPWQKMNWKIEINDWWWYSCWNELTNLKT